MKAVDSVKAWVERRPKQAVLVAAIIAVLIGAQIGFVVGYKVEHDRTSSDVARLKRAATDPPKTSTTKPKGAVAGGGGRRDGKVTAVAPGSITIKSRQGPTVTINLSSTTKVDKVVKGALSDITANRHVLVVPPGLEVLVLPQGNTQGRTVKSVSKTSLVLLPGNGLPAATAKVTTATVIDTLSPASAADVKVGDTIIALGKAAKTGPLAATEVIIIPATSKFSG